MNLVKYCNSDHAADALTSGKLFVGSFWRYHRIENKALRDQEEGPAIPAVVDDVDGITISEDDNNTLLAHSSVKMANGWKLHMPRNMPLWLEQPAFNTFIFCVSDDPAPSLEKAARLGYDNFFRITDPVQFGETLATAVATHCKSRYGV